MFPTVAEGLNRIVIASRFGNECVDTNGHDQLIVDDALFYQRDEDGTVTNIVDLPPE